MNRRSFLLTSAALLAVSSVASGASLLAPEGAPAEQELRTVEVYQKGERWVQVPWEGLKRGMIFRLRGTDGEVADMDTEHEVSVALEDAVREQSPAFWGVKCEPFTYVKKDHPLAGRVLVLHLGEPVGFLEEIDMTMSKGWSRASKVPGDGLPKRTRLIRFDEVQVDLDGWGRYDDLTVPA